jgi:hypothetical protein
LITLYWDPKPSGALSDLLPSIRMVTSKLTFDRSLRLCCNLPHYEGQGESGYDKSEGNMILHNNITVTEHFWYTCLLDLLASVTGGS